jgi:hypothetical protein
MYGNSVSKMLLGVGGGEATQKFAEHNPELASRTPVFGLIAKPAGDRVVEKQEQLSQQQKDAFTQELMRKYPAAFMSPVSQGGIGDAFSQETISAAPRKIM